MIVKEKKMAEAGVIFDIQRYSLHDGPGIRTVVFMKGCPLACLWCANPESQRAEPELMLSARLCLACDECVRVCSRNAIAIQSSSNGRRSPKINWDACDGCLKCTIACPTGTLIPIGRLRTVSELLEIIRLDQAFFNRSGGGVTLSGGEPTIQSTFAKAVLQGSKESGIHTALETSGFCEWEALDELLSYADMVYFDLKHLDPVLHESLTGMRNERILENLARVIRAKQNVTLRIPLIPEHNDDEGYLMKLATFLYTLDRNLSIEVVPFHQMGGVKYQRLGRDYPLQAIPPMEKARLESCKDLLRSNGLKVI